MMRLMDSAHAAAFWLSIVTGIGLMPANAGPDLLAGHERDGGQPVRDLAPAQWQRLKAAGGGDAAAAHPAVVQAPEALTMMDGEVLQTDVGLPVAFPGSNEYMRPVESSWDGWRHVNVTLHVPSGFPEQSEIVFFTKDWDYYWHQIRIPFPGRASERLLTFQLPLVGPEAEQRWEPVEHWRTWHELMPDRVRYFGIKFDPARGVSLDYDGAVHVTDIWLSTPIEAAKRLAVSELEYAPSQPEQGKLCEFTFKLEGFSGNPFDRDQLAVTARITAPDGSEERVFGFYYEGFVSAPGGPRNALVPFGAPRFKVRYTPRHSGTHRVHINVVHGDHDVGAPPVTLDVAAPAQPFKGFVRVDETDRRQMSYSNGGAFNGIGVNVRATYDLRYNALVPFTTNRDEGLNLYRRLFAKYEQHGINVVEVWMCSWWLALEWIPDAPGNHGLGHMNQHRSWKLDELMRMAEDHGIYVILVLNNHGKVSTFCDQEWHRNPLNTANGGFLDSPNEFYSDARAKDAFRLYAAYTVARWGHSPNLLMWKLFSEINLTGTHGNWYRDPAVAQWHREMGAYVKQIDPYKHPVTTHWSTDYRVINDAIADLPEMDLLTTDAYAGTTRAVASLFDGSARYAKRKNKPMIVTEFGGTPMGDSIGNLKKQVNLANWKGWFNQFPVTPMFWWFFMIDELDLYPKFEALARFVDGEDTRGMQAQMQELPDTDIVLHVLTGAERTLIYGYDTGYYYASEENLQPERFVNHTVDVTGLSAGSYDVEFWDCETGRIRSRQQVQVDSEQRTLTLVLPTFEKQFALKLMRVEQQLAQTP